MFEQLLLIVYVFVLVVLLVGGVGNKDGVDAAEQLGLELQVFLHELLPELPLGLVQRHCSHEGCVQLGDFLEETLAVSLLNCVPRLLSLLVFHPREREGLVRDTRPLEVCRIKPLYTQCLIQGYLVDSEGTWFQKGAPKFILSHLFLINDHLLEEILELRISFHLHHLHQLLGLKWLLGADLLRWHLIEYFFDFIGRVFGLIPRKTEVDARLAPSELDLHDLHLYWILGRYNSDRRLDVESVCIDQVMSVTSASP